MATYNIYGSANGNDSDNSPQVTVVLSDDDTEILDVIPRHNSDEDDTEEVLRDYVERGATPIEALRLYTNSYGFLEKVTSGSIPPATSGESR